jgi:hypothetical protein
MYQSMNYEEFRPKPKQQYHLIQTIHIWMFDKDCTGKFKVNPIIFMDKVTHFIIHQEVKRKKYIFFSETLYVPMKDLITYSSDKAQTMLEDVKKFYKPIHRAKVLAQVLK